MFDVPLPIPEKLLLKDDEKKKIPKKKRYAELRLKPADIVLIQSDGFVGWAIRQKSRVKGERPTRANHVALVIAAPDYIMDAQPPRVTVAALMDTYGPRGDRIGIYRMIDLTDEQRRAIANRALKYDARPYGYGKIVLHWFSQFGFLLGWFNKFTFSDGYPICSYLVGRPYFEVVNWLFGKPANVVQPDDIDDHIHDHLEGNAEGNPVLYQTIRRMTPLEGDW